MRISGGSDSLVAHAVTCRHFESMRSQRRASNVLLAEL